MSHSQKRKKPQETSRNAFCIKKKCGEQLILQIEEAKFPDGNQSWWRALFPEK